MLRAPGPRAAGEHNLEPRPSRHDGQPEDGRGRVHAAKCGAKVVEGYPVEPRKDPMPDVFAWTGMASAFRKVGFKEVARRASSRPIMRIEP
jgi:hypothetical protein